MGFNTKKLSHGHSLHWLGWFGATPMTWDTSTCAVAHRPCPRWSWLHGSRSKHRWCWRDIPSWQQSRSPAPAKSQVPPGTMDDMWKNWIKSQPPWYQNHLFIQFEKWHVDWFGAHAEKLPDHPILTRVVGLFGLVASHALLPQVSLPTKAETDWEFALDLPDFVFGCKWVRSSSYMTNRSTPLPRRIQKSLTSALYASFLKPQRMRSIGWRRGWSSGPCPTTLYLRRGNPSTTVP